MLYKTNDHLLPLIYFYLWWKKKVRWWIIYFEIWKNIYILPLCLPSVTRTMLLHVCKSIIEFSCVDIFLFQVCILPERVCVPVRAFFYRKLIIKKKFHNYNRPKRQHIDKLLHSVLGRMIKWNHLCNSNGFYESMS